MFINFISKNLMFFFLTKNLFRFSFIIQNTILNLYLFTNNSLF